MAFMAAAADELREKVGFANNEMRMAFQKETLKTAGPRMSRSDKEKGEFAIKKAEQASKNDIPSVEFIQDIVEASLMQTFSHDYVWAQDINLDGSQR